MLKSYYALTAVQYKIYCTNHSAIHLHCTGCSFAQVLVAKLSHFDMLPNRWQTIRVFTFYKFFASHEGTQIQQLLTVFSTLHMLSYLSPGKMQTQHFYEKGYMVYNYSSG